MNEIRYIKRIQKIVDEFMASYINAVVDFKEVKKKRRSEILERLEAFERGYKQGWAEGRREMEEEQQDRDEMERDEIIMTTTEAMKCLNEIKRRKDD